MHYDLFSSDNKIICFFNANPLNVDKRIFEEKLAMEQKTKKDGFNAIVGFKLTPVLGGGFANVDNNSGIHLSGTVVLEGVQIKLKCK